MKKYFILIFLSSLISLSAQNIIINGKFSKPFNENFERAYILEALVATNNNMFSIGVFLGIAKLDFNNAGYDWAASYEDTYTKGIHGIVTYIYPLTLTNINYLQNIYFSYTWAQISDYGFFPGGGYMFWGTGYAYPGSKNEKLWIVSSGYKIPFESVNVLLGVGYQHREYDLSFREYDESLYSPQYRLIHQIEKSIQIDIALQYIF